MKLLLTLCSDARPTLDHRTQIVEIVEFGIGTIGGRVLEIAGPKHLPPNTATGCATSRLSAR
ncbi:hypothetical protein CKO23_04350 [Thiocystis violacea]|nr:hypothetical protein [Thiocystis violacea]